jgi:hypothetical protein
MTTDSVGLAIRDALDLLDGIVSVECDSECVPIEYIDDSDCSNLRLLLANGEVFTIRVILKGA